jgi:hypothetical protein
MTDHHYQPLIDVVLTKIAPHQIDPDAWPQIIDLALAHGLGPMLLHRVRKAEHSTVDACWSPLIAAAREASARVILNEVAYQRITAALAQAGLPALWLKGIALAGTVYPDPGLRPMNDLDALVPYDQREQALACAQAAGYHFRHLPELNIDTGDARFAVSTQHYHLIGGPANRVTFELHYRLVGANDSLLSLADHAWFWDQRQVMHRGNWRVETLTPEAHLLYLCAHAELQHGEAHLYLLRYFDMHLLITECAPAWDVLVDQAVALRWTYAAKRALTLCIEMFGTPVPDTVIQALRSRRPAAERVGRVAALQGPGAKLEQLRRRLVAMSLRDRLHTLRSLLLPAPAYMRYRYHLRDGVPVWPAYLRRWWESGVKVVWVIWERLKRSPR